MSNKKPGTKATAPEASEQPSLSSIARSAKPVETEVVTPMGENFPIYAAHKDLKIGEFAEGVYLGTETRGKDDDGDDRTVHVFQGNGSKFGLWDRGGLNLLYRVPTGTFTKVTYASFNPENKRPVPQHIFDISLEKGASLLPPTAAKAATANASVHQ